MDIILQRIYICKNLYIVELYANFSIHFLIRTIAKVIIENTLQFAVTLISNKC